MKTIHQMVLGISCLYKLKSLFFFSDIWFCLDSWRNGKHQVYWKKPAEPFAYCAARWVNIPLSLVN